MGDMRRFDETRLQQMIVRHRDYTGSKKADKILQNWQVASKQFIKVMPTEYRKALANLYQATATDARAVDLAVNA
jgi:glutamate synthase (NADPH) large chain